MAFHPGRDGNEVRACHVVETKCGSILENIFPGPRSVHKFTLTSPSEALQLLFELIYLVLALPPAGLLFVKIEELAHSETWHMFRAQLMHDRMQRLQRRPSYNTAPTGVYWR